MTQVICTGCGSSWTDAELAEEKAKNPKLLSCCPERQPLGIEGWKSRDDAARAALREIVNQCAEAAYAAYATVTTDEYAMHGPAIVGRKMLAAIKAVSETQDQ